MSENWTKGPWSRIKWDIIGSDNSRTCRVIPWDESGCHEEDVANANLIAAAPELYEALELIYGRLLMSDRDGECRITAEDGEMAKLALMAYSLRHENGETSACLPFASQISEEVGRIRSQRDRRSGSLRARKPSHPPDDSG